MLAFIRAVLAAALALPLSRLSFATEKPFQRGDLVDAAIKLETQIKAEAEADAAFQRNDFHGTWARIAQSSKGDYAVRRKHRRGRCPWIAGCRG